MLLFNYSSFPNATNSVLHSLTPYVDSPLSICTCLTLMKEATICKVGILHISFIPKAKQGESGLPNLLCREDQTTEQNI